jgi:hypothetical protein
MATNGGFGSGANNPTLTAAAALAPRIGGKPGESLQARAAAATTAAPPTAAAAPTPATTQTGTGLCAAINAYYAEQAKNSGFIPDVYEIKFADPLLENASMIPAGPKEKEFTGAIPLSASDKLDPTKQNAPLQIRSRGTTAGQQIVQFIDQVMRSSRYIGDQQNVTWNTSTNSWDPQGKPGQVFAWYNIVSNAVPLKYDPARNDFAYRLIYTITPYQTPIQSEYFNAGVFRGVHKVYNYWFTGQNTQVLQYEQSFNTLWHQAITGDKGSTETIRNQTNTSFLWKKSYLPASNETRQGGTGKTFEPGANAADILYSSDYAKIKLNIIGDPAWIPSIVPLTSGKFVTAPFNPDGSINNTASAPYFKFAWNRPVDYNLSTGLMDPGINNYRTNFVQTAGEAQESVAYIASRCRSSFKGGKFTQELEGTWLQDLDAATATTSAATTGIASGPGGIVAATTSRLDTGRNTDPAAGVAQVNTLASGATSRAFGDVVSSVVKSPNVLQAGVLALKEYGTTALTNFVQPYAEKLTSVGIGLFNSITSISKPTPRVPPPPTAASSSIPAPPTLSTKPGESASGVYIASAAQPSPLPQQGIVQDDQGP